MAPPSFPIIGTCQDMAPPSFYCCSEAMTMTPHGICTTCCNRPVHGASIGLGVGARSSNYEVDALDREHGYEPEHEHENLPAGAQKDRT